MKVQQMTCAQALTLLIDEPGDEKRDERLIARLHASQCPKCSGAYDPAHPQADALCAVVTRRTRPSTTLRTILWTISVTQLVLAIPWLVGKSLLPDSHVSVSHLTRDGALGIVIAALGLVTVWRPRYVHGTRLIGIVVLGLQLVAGIADQQMSSISASFEVVHFLVVIIVLGLFAVAADLARRATPSAKPRPRALHAIPQILRSNTPSTR